MANFNKVILLGNLTRDPELRFTPKGQAVAKLGMAVNRSYKTEIGEVKEETTFVDIEAWGKQAELMGQYLRKGNPLFVEGRLRLDQWDDKNTGQKVSKLKVVMENFQFIGGPRGGESGPGGPGGPGGPPPTPSMGSAPANAPANTPTGPSSPSSRPAARPADPAAPDGNDAAVGEVDDVPF